MVWVRLPNDVLVCLGGFRCSSLVPTASFSVLHHVLERPRTAAAVEERRH